MALAIWRDGGTLSAAAERRPAARPDPAGSALSARIWRRSLPGTQLLEAHMVHELGRLGRNRFIGDSRNKVVHDRWHKDCQGCGLNELLRDGHAVGFSPDTLDAALWEDYEYCEACHDRTEPSPPKWARAEDRTADQEGDGEAGRGAGAGRRSSPESRQAGLSAGRPLFVTGGDVHR
jgi:hypothetical protein